MNILPIIHLNGTGPETLRDDALSIRIAVMDLIEAFVKSEFNARDYYPVDGLWDKAVAERKAFMGALHDAAQHFEQVAMKAQEVVDARETRRMS
jgi:hypothetical protein